MLLAGFADTLSIVSGIAQYHHVGFFAERQFANHLGRCLGGCPVFEAFLGAVFFGVVRDLKGDSVPRRSDQQTKREAVNVFAPDLLFVVATTFLGPPLSVPGAVGVLGLSTGLREQRCVDDEEEFAFTRLHLQQGESTKRGDVVFLPTRPGQETGELAAVDRL